MPPKGFPGPLSTARTALGREPHPGAISMTKSALRQGVTYWARCQGASSGRAGPPFPLGQLSPAEGASSPLACIAGMESMGPRPGRLEGGGRLALGRRGNRRRLAWAF